MTSNPADMASARTAGGFDVCISTVPIVPQFLYGWEVTESRR